MNTAFLVSMSIIIFFLKTAVFYVAFIGISGCFNNRKESNLEVNKIPSNQYIVDPGIYYRYSILENDGVRFLALDLINHTDRDLVFGNQTTLTSVKIRNKDNDIVYAQGFKKSARIGGPQNVIMLSSHSRAHPDGQICGFEIWPIRYEIPNIKGPYIEFEYRNWVIDIDGSTKSFSIKEIIVINTEAGNDDL